jgi:hypothetical protein
LVLQVQAPFCVATHVLLPSTDLPNGFGVQHLWVCESFASASSTSRVSVVSLHTNKPCVVDSFALADSGIVSAIERVPGVTTSSSDKFAFTDDTVWIAIDDK